MADKKIEQVQADAVIGKAKDFWGKNGKIITIASVAIILLAGGWYGYKAFVKEPREKKAREVIFKAEEYYRMDSASLAVNGDGVNWGFAKIADKYGNTKAGNLAKYYAGSCYIKLNDNEKAVKYLKKFSTSSKPLQQRAYKLLADAYADLGKNSDALSYYKKAAAQFPEDKAFSGESLLMAAYLSHKVMNDSKTAVELYKEIKDKYPAGSTQAQQADMYLGQLGVYSDNN